MTSRRINLAELAERVATPQESTSGGDMPAGESPDGPSSPAASPGRDKAHPVAQLPPPAGEPEDDQAATVKPRGSRRSHERSRGPRAARATRSADSTPPVGARTHYLEFERKETRLRADQYGELTAESRRLNRLRKGEGDRLTENTLIRVAVDLLLSKRTELAGVNEEELRKSVGL